MQFLVRMLQDRSGNFWAAGAGLFLVEEKAGRVSIREVNLNLPQGWKAWKPSFNVSDLAEGDDGSLWLGTTYGASPAAPRWPSCAIQREQELWPRRCPPTARRR